MKILKIKTFLLWGCREKDTHTHTHCHLVRNFVFIELAFVALNVSHTYRKKSCKKPYKVVHMKLLKHLLGLDSSVKVLHRHVFEKT